MGMVSVEILKPLLQRSPCPHRGFWQVASSWGNICDFKQDLRMQSFETVLESSRTTLRISGETSCSLITLSLPAGVSVSLLASAVGCSCVLEQSPPQHQRIITPLTVASFWWSPSGRGEPLTGGMRRSRCSVSGFALSWESQLSLTPLRKEGGAGVGDAYSNLFPTFKLL